MTLMFEDHSCTVAVATDAESGDRAVVLKLPGVSLLLSPDSARMLGNQLLGCANAIVLMNHPEEGKPN